MKSASGTRTTPTSRPRRAKSARSAGRGAAPGRAIFEAAPGEIGEIGGKGASLMLGYFDDQQATEAAFNATGWFMTGDLGWIDAAGYLRVTGRKKEIIIRGGHNIHPARIESLALRHPA